MAKIRGNSGSNIVSVKAKRRYGWLWLGVASLAGGILTANSFSPDNDFVMANSKSVFDAGITGTLRSIFRQPEISLDARVRQLIDSGQLDPPPGNTHKMYSIASPFNHSLQATTPGSLPGDEGGQRIQSPTQAGGSMISFNRTDAIGTSGTTQVTQSANSQTQASSQLTEFDTPPGVGSSTGGR